MSITLGPNLAGRESLVAYYDSENLRSYKGEPTVNLITDQAEHALPWMGIEGNYTFNGLQTTGEFAGWYKMTAHKIRGGAGRSIARLQYFNASIGDEYTASMEWVSSHPDLTFEFVGQQALGTAIPMGGNRYYSHTVATAAGNQAWALTHTTGSPSQTLPDLVIYYRNNQTELKDHPTPFVNGTRPLIGGWKDLSPSKNHIDLTNSGFLEGKPSLNGVDQYIDTGFGDGYNLSTDSLTIETWVKLGRVSGANQIIFASDYSSTTRLYLETVNDKYLTISLGNSLGDTSSIEMTTSWTNISVTIDGPTKTAKVYVDGVYSGHSQSYVGFSILGPIRLGRYTASAPRWMQGSQDLIRIFSRALTAAEVKQNYDNFKGRFQ